MSAASTRSSSSRPAQGADGQREVAPMAVLGLHAGREPDARRRRPLGRALRAGAAARLPAGLAPSTTSDYFAVCVDAKADALSAAEGERLFDDAGEPTPILAERRQFLEEIEREAQRTRLFGRRLLELELLRRCASTPRCPTAAQLSVDGFLALDEKQAGGAARRHGARRCTGPACCR